MRKLFSLFLALVATTALWAEDFKVNGIYYNILTDKTNEVEVTYRGESYSEYSNEYSGSVTIPETVIYNGTTYSVMSIRSSAFRGCSGLTSITIPNSVTSIGGAAFFDCSSLTSITIPNSVTSIGSSAFRGCSSLTTVNIPNSVTSIGSSTFSGCSSLTSPLYNAHYFAYMPTSYSGAYAIPEGIKKIADDAFSYCSSLTSVTIPNSVTSIGDYAFQCCYALTSITIPNSVTTIAGHAFEYCSRLTSITIPNSVTSIGWSAFFYCSSLTSITIPNSVTWIGNGAFEGCKGLTSIESLAEVPPTLGSSAFDNVSTTIPVYVPCGKVAAYQSAEGWKAFTNIQEPQAEYSIQVSTFDSQMGTAKVDYNTFCGNQISVTTNIGYHFTQWSDGNTDNPRSLVLTQDTTLTAEFAINTYTLTTKSNGNGNVTGNGTYKHGENVIISATADIGYHFVQWNDGNTDNPRTVQVTEEKTYTAYFEKNTYSITKQYDAQQGTISGPASGQYLENITLTAVPQTGYHFTQWSDGVTTNPRTIVLTQDTTIAAFFAVNQYQITVSSNNTDAGVVNGSGTHNYGTYTEISATANNGYHFSHWNDGNTDNPRVVQVTEDQIYTAYFYKNTYTVSVDYNSAYGTVAGPTSGEFLDEITLTATPNLGYCFTGWSDGVKDNPRTIVLTKDLTLTANFAQAYSGKCGDNLYWKYDSDTKTIAITGSGNMYNYTASTQPWILFKEQILKVEVANEATSLGASAFEGCIRLGEVHIGQGLEFIYENVFAACNRLYHVYCYPTYPPFAVESSFSNYNVYLYIPCHVKEDYELDMVWGLFKYIQCIGAETDEEVPEGEVTTTTTNTSVTITWPTEENADSYTIEIKKGDKVFCTLTFTKDGQLTNIAFAPGRDGQNRIQYAEMTAKGLRFTVTSLDAGTQYSYDVTTKDKDKNIIASYTGEFTTKSDITTDLENTDIQYPITNIRKEFRDGQLIILRDGVEYNAMGQEL